MPILQKTIQFVEEKTHQFQIWRYNYYIYLALFFGLFVATMWISNPLFKIPMMAIAFLSGGKFLKSVEENKSK
jgi:hypothetical protein